MRRYAAPTSPEARRANRADTVAQNDGAFWWMQDDGSGQAGRAADATDGDTYAEAPRASHASAPAGGDTASRRASGGRLAAPGHAYAGAPPRAPRAEATTRAPVAAA